MTGALIEIELAYPTKGKPLAERASLYEDERVERVLAQGVVKLARCEIDTNISAWITAALKGGTEDPKGPSTLAEARALLVAEHLPIPQLVAPFLEGLGPPSPSVPGSAVPSPEQLAQELEPGKELSPEARKDALRASLVERLSRRTG